MKTQKIKMPAFKGKNTNPKDVNKKKIAVGIVASVLAVALSIVALSVGIRESQLKEYKNRVFRLPSQFTITAHTGCMKTPENSINSMNAGVANGADIIEFDVNFLEDGTPVLCHDTPKGDEVTLDEAFEYLAKHKNLQANVDMKSVDNMAEVERLAIKHGVIKKIFLTGINIDTVTTVHKDAPKLKYYLNISVDEEKNTDREYLSSLTVQVEKCEALGINMNYKGASAELVQAFHIKNLKVSLWTVDDLLDMYDMLSLSPDNITTRNPDKLSEIVG